MSALYEMDVVETFSKCHYITCKYSFPMICHKLGVPIDTLKLSPFAPFSKWGDKLSSLIKTIKNRYNRFSGGIILISRYSTYIEVSWDLMDILYSSTFYLQLILDLALTQLDISIMFICKPTTRRCD